MSIKSAIYKGHVFHKRFKPHAHQLRYRVCSFLFDLDELPELDQKISGFGYNRFALYAFWDKDFGPRQQKPLRPYVESLLQKMDLPSKNCQIKLLCYPRILGYIFNPLAVYFCYHPEGHLMAVLYEVSNTFGQYHTYCIPVSAKSQGRKIRQSCQKSFFVSPFIPMDVTYHFTILPPAEQTDILIKETDQAGTLLTASFNGKRSPITAYALWRLFTTYPLMTLKVIAGIHWEAFHIWRKGNRLFKTPPAPALTYSLITDTHNNLSALQGGSHDTL